MHSAKAALPGNTRRHGMCFKCIGIFCEVTLANRPVMCTLPLPSKLIVSAVAGCEGGVHPNRACFVVEPIPLQCGKAH